MNLWVPAAFTTARSARNAIFNRLCPLAQQPNNIASRLPSHFLISKPSRVSPQCLQLLRRASSSTRPQRGKGKAKGRPQTLPPSPAPSNPVGPPLSAAEHSEGTISQDGEALTWRDYDPLGGMPLGPVEFTQKEIDNIFDTRPKELDVEKGNYILNVLNYRRISGSLIDHGLSFPLETGVTQGHALRGLQYLRSLDPQFDETAAGQQWVDEETRKLQNQLITRAESLGIYKKAKVDEDAMSEEEEQQGTVEGRRRSGDSALIAIREENEAKWEAEQAQKARDAERQASAELAAARGPLELQGGVQPPGHLIVAGHQGIGLQKPQSKAWLQPVERKPWVKYYEERAQIIKDQSIPNLSAFARLAPSFLFLLAVGSVCLFLSDNYSPPPNSARMFPDTPPAVATLTTLTGLLCLGFVAGRFPPFWRTLSKYFTLVPAYPYAVSLVGVIFRHNTLAHLAPNVAVLWLLGLMLHEDVGRGTFLAIFFSSGVIGAYASLLHCVATRSWMHYIYGSSGAVLGVVGAACTLHPNATISIAGYDLPIAAWVFVALFGAMEVYALVKRRKGTNIDHGGHVGGIVTGVASALYLRSNLKDQPVSQDHTEVTVD